MGMEVRFPAGLPLTDGGSRSLVWRSPRKADPDCAAYSSAPHAAGKGKKRATWGSTVGDQLVSGRDREFVERLDGGNGAVGWERCIAWANDCDCLPAGFLRGGQFLVHIAKEKQLAGIPFQPLRNRPVAA